MNRVRFSVIKFDGNNKKVPNTYKNSQGVLFQFCSFSISNIDQKRSHPVLQIGCSFSKSNLTWLPKALQGKVKCPLLQDRMILLNVQGFCSWSNASYCSWPKMWIGLCSRSLTILWRNADFWNCQKTTQNTLTKCKQYHTSVTNQGGFKKVIWSEMCSPNFSCVCVL